MIRLLLNTLAASTMLSGAAYAATGSVNFSGTVTSTCTLTVTNGTGTLAPSSSLLNLSSKNAGGLAGAVSLSTTGGVTLSVDPASSPVQPASDLLSTVWTPSYSLSGVQTVLDSAASTSIAAPGTGTVAVHLTATKAGGGSFHTGTYGATVTVRCEP